MDDANPRIGDDIQHGRGAVLRTVIDDDQFKIGKCPGQYGVDCLGQSSKAEMALAAKLTGADTTPVLASRFSARATSISPREPRAAARSCAAEAAAMVLATALPPMPWRETHR
jgi:hypothetical protein